MILLVLLLVISSLAALYWLFFSSYSQFFGDFPYQVKTTKKVVALTFDDGPNEPYTSEIVNYLNSQHIKATFFEVGQCVLRYPEVTKQIYASGHTIGNHSLSHSFSNYLRSSAFIAEVTGTQAIIKQAIGKTPVLFRPPWLFRQPPMLKAIKIIGLQPVSGKFCHALEVFQINGKWIAKRAIAKVRPGTIIIFHDGHDARGGNRKQTVEAIKLVTQALKQQGYEFVTVDKLLGIPAYFEDQSPA